MSTTESSQYDRDLDAVIQIHLNALYHYTPGSEQYTDAVKSLEVLNDLKPKPRERISPDTALMVAGNLIGILVVVGYERMNILTSKATMFWGKMR